VPFTRSSSRFAALAAFALAGTAAGAPAERTHVIQPEDYFTINLLDELALSPDGSAIAYTEMRWDEGEDKRNTDLWVVDTSTRKTVRLTFDPASDGAPEWSPDGKWIYFTSSPKRDEGDKAPYNGKKQVWRIPAQGGEVTAVTRVPKGISAFHLSADGRSLYYTRGTEHVEKDEWESLRKEFKDVTYGDGVETYSELWKLDLESWRETMLVDARRVIVAFTVDPDGKRIAMVTRPTEKLITNEGWSTVDIYDAGTEAVTSLPDRMWRDEAPSPFGWIIEPCWSSDGKVLAFRVDFDGYPGEVFFAHFDQGAEPLIQKMVRPRQVSVEGGMRWKPGTRDLCFIAADHARAPVLCVRDIRGGKQGGDVVMTPGDRVVLGFGFSDRAEPLAVIMNGMDHPPDLFLVRGSGGGARFDRITRINPQVDTWKVPQLSIAKWTSKDGTPVEGVLELPPDYKTGDGPLPMVLVLHGGPTSAEPFCFRYWIYGRTLFAAQGWAMLAPNYRGSTGYGDEFLSQLIGNKNNLDVMDILSGVDALIERGVVDPERMAVMGWSNGGYLTNCIITRDNRFKAASSGAGVFDTAMQWSIEDTPGHVINFSKGLPWESADTMRETSPLYNADKVTTPTIIHVGEKDERVPQEHSRGLYRALRTYMKVPAELIIYPGEGHGLTKYSHRKAKLTWDVRWFDHHVLGKMDEDLE
jgi:dipeptidyl aminopeptidase/acylaminoacyl peptidase